MSGKKMQKNEVQRKGVPQQQKRKSRAISSTKPVAAPAAKARKVMNRPAIIKQGPRSIRVIHREFIGNVTGDQLFTLKANFSINPGLSDGFPWLAGIANNWDEYRFHKLCFVFLTRTGTSTPGSVIMSPDYDSSDGVPASEQIMTTFANTVEDAPWKDIRCDLDPLAMAGGMSRKFVRSLPLNPNQDIKTYDSGNFFLATVDSSGPNISFGKLWVEYDVEFWVPSLHSTGTSMGGEFKNGSVPVAARPFGTNPIKVGSTQGILLGTDPGTSRNVLTIQSAGDYLCSQEVQGTGMTADGLTSPPVLQTGAGTIVDLFSGINGAIAQAAKWHILGASANSTFLMPVMNGLSVTASNLEVVRAITGSII